MRAILAILLLTIATSVHAQSIGSTLLALPELSGVSAGGGSPTFPSGATAYWKLDDAVPYDDSISTNSITSSFYPDVVTGKINNGADFIRANFDRMSALDSPDLDAGTDVDISWSAWVNFDDFANIHCILSKNVSAQGYQIHATTTSNIVVQVWTGGSTSHADDTQLVAGTWYHIAVTYDQSNIRIYIDGALSTTSANTTDFPANSDLFYVGWSGAGGSSQAMEGIIDEVGVWSGKKLSDAEVSDLYNSGTGLQP